MGVRAHVRLASKGGHDGIAKKSHESTFRVESSFKREREVAASGEILLAIAALNAVGVESSAARRLVMRGCSCNNLVIERDSAAGFIALEQAIVVAFVKVFTGGSDHAADYA
jgi:hypothetical protein